MYNMAEDIYNPSTDNLEKEEEPRLNPSTGISSFIKPKQLVQAQKERNVLSETLKKIDAERKAMLDKKEMEIEKLQSKTEQKAYQAGKSEGKISSKVKPSFMRRFGFVKRGKEARPLQERLKIMRLGNMLEKKRLQNQIQKMKLQRQVDLLKKKGMLKQVIQQPVFKAATPLYPAYATPEIMGDIDSAFNADMNGSGDFWGNERYHNENYYDEDYYGQEFEGTDPFLQLCINIRKNTSPLLW